MLEQITDEIIGLGPLEPLLRDESISEVMVNGPRQCLGSLRGNTRPYARRAGLEDSEARLAELLAERRSRRS